MNQSSPRRLRADGLGPWPADPRRSGGVSAVPAVPAPRAFPEGWTIGKPDVVFEIPEPYYVPAQGVVAYVHFMVPTNFTEDKWIQAAEAVPGDRSVVHHIVVYLLDPTARTGSRGRPRSGRSQAPRHPVRRWSARRRPAAASGGPRVSGRTRAFFKRETSSK